MITSRMHTLEPLLLSLLIALLLSMSARSVHAQPASSDHPASAASQAEWPDASSSAGDDANHAKDDGDDDDDEESARHDDRHHHRHHDDSVVNLGSNSELRDGEQAQSVVAIFGSSTSAGVADDVGAIFGNTHVTGPVKNSVFSIFGNVYVDGPVGDDVVAVFGNVELGPHADVRGDASAVFGSVTRDPAARVHGDVNSVGGGIAGRIGWFEPWIEHCLLYGRPLALVSGIGWAWGLALGFLALYVCLALLFPAAVSRCVTTLETEPGMSLVAALLTLLLTPITLVLLCITLIGIGVIPFLLFGLFCLGLFGKAVMLAWLGRRCASVRGPVVLHSALAVLLGGIVVLVLYLVPVLGFIVYKVLGVLGLGVVAYTLVHAARASRAPAASAGETSPSMAPPVSAAFARAGFWIRLAALLIDALLVGVLLGVVHHHGDFFLVILAIYGAVMWKLRGSTVGGIVFDLQVVRLDGRPIGWETAIVRALGCFLSLVVVGLGFFWIAFDHGKQAWHDKIAGTAVVRVPKGSVSLV
jgi:uncharacterized RDD family membrane protein YckC